VDITKPCQMGPPNSEEISSARIPHRTKHQRTLPPKLIQISPPCISDGRASPLTTYQLLIPSPHADSPHLLPIEACAVASLQATHKPPKVYAAASPALALTHNPFPNRSIKL
ncbi:unnamed protein product, partial [Dovyalis caffra]